MILMVMNINKSKISWILTKRCDYQWCRQVDSNHQPFAYEATALPLRAMPAQL